MHVHRATKTEIVAAKCAACQSALVYVFHQCSHFGATAVKAVLGSVSAYTSMHCTGTAVKQSEWSSVGSEYVL